MDKKLFAIIMVLILFVCTGCDNSKQIQKLNVDEIYTKLNEGNLLDSLVQDYDRKYDENLLTNRIELYSIKPYKKGVLVLTCYRGEMLELILFYIEKNKNNDYSFKSAKGQFLPQVSVNSLDDDNNIIYFGNLDNDYIVSDTKTNANEAFPKIILNLDDGRKIEEKIKPKDKGYIITSNSKGSVVDLIFYDKNNKPLNYIKEFVNYSLGISETTWDKKK